MSRQPKHSEKRNEGDSASLHSFAELGAAFGIPAQSFIPDIIGMHPSQRASYFENWKSTSWKQRASDQIKRLHSPHEESKLTLNIITDMLVLEALGMTKEEMEREGIASIDCVGPIPQGSRSGGRNKRFMRYPFEQDQWANLYRGYAFSPLIFVNFEEGRLQSTMGDIMYNTQNPPDRQESLENVAYVRRLLDTNPMVSLHGEKTEQLFNRIFREILALMGIISSLKNLNIYQGEDANGIKSDLRFRAIYQLKDRAIAAYFEEAERLALGSQIILREKASSESPFVPADSESPTTMRKYWDIKIVNTFGDIVDITWRGNIDLEAKEFISARGMRAKIPRGATIITADDTTDTEKIVRH